MARIYGTEDNPKSAYSDAKENSTGTDSCIFLGLPFRQLLENNGIAAKELWEEGEEHTIWNARLYPACPTIREALQASLNLYAMTRGKGDVSKWRSHKISVFLFQSMHYHVGRNLFVININIGKQYIIPKFGPMMDITHLQVTVLSTYCMAGKHAVVACHLIVIAAPHMPAPSKICIILHSTAHQFQDFSGGSKMNKFCGHQPQEFHAERPFMHKQTVETLRECGAVNEQDCVDIDTGAIIFSKEMLAALYQLISQEGKFSEELFEELVNEKVRL